MTGVSASTVKNENPTTLLDDPVSANAAAQAAQSTVKPYLIPGAAEYKEIMAADQAELDYYEIALVTSLDARFAGEVMFSRKNGKIILHEYTPSSSTQYTMDYDTHAALLSKSLKDKVGDIQINSIMPTWIEGVGYAMVTQDEDHVRYVTTIGLQQRNSPMFASEETALTGTIAAETIATYTPGEIIAAAEKKAEAAPAKLAEPVLINGNPETGGGTEPQQADSAIPAALAISAGGLAAVGAGLHHRKAEQMR